MYCFIENGLRLIVGLLGLYAMIQSLDALKDAFFPPKYIKIPFKSRLEDAIIGFIALGLGILIIVSAIVLRIN